MFRVHGKHIYAGRNFQEVRIEAHATVTVPVDQGHLWSVGGALCQWTRVTCGQWEGHCASDTCGQWEGNCASEPGSLVVSGRDTVPVDQGHLWSVGGALCQ